MALKKIQSRLPLSESKSIQSSIKQSAQALQEEPFASVLTRSESLFSSSYRYQRALEKLAPPEKLMDFSCVMDLLFCEIFPEYQDRCNKYYQKKGKKLVEIENSLLIEELDFAMLTGLKAALLLYQKYSEITWAEYIQGIRALALEVLRQRRSNRERVSDGS